jgi:hypothetical protein
MSEESSEFMMRKRAMQYLVSVDEYLFITGRDRNNVMCMSAQARRRANSQTAMACSGAQGVDSRRVFDWEDIMML